ncbi:septation protein SepH [Nocardioides gilvus]|uniref:septation protein SepH n=1 Tax=Nocardioides gilvus TaxID=1735589 RepID=UPI0013A5B289|nr:septation protein SepH [Nocardioides gilvus]
MAHLTLVGLSEDRTRLLLVADGGEKFTLDIDTALRSALRGEQPRPGHLETRMDSALRPRDIQARIRAGETAEAVAEAARSSVEKIMPYAAPVLAERAHVAERAQLSSVRRRATEGTGSLGGGRTLREAVAHQLRGHNVDPESVEWDAFRREDGRWTLTGLFETSTRSGTGTFTFDMRGNYVNLEDEDARWLVGDAPQETAAAVAPEVAAGQRRLSAVRSDAPALGDDAIELVTPARPELDSTPDFIRNLTPDSSAPAATDRAASTPAPSEQAPTGTPRPAAPESASTDAEAEAESESESPAATEPPAEAPRRSSKKRGRASVPSWDEIMFGGGTNE